MVLEATILRSLCLLSDSILARSCDNLRNSQNFLFLKLARYKLENDRTSIVELRIVCKSRMLQKHAHSSIKSAKSTYKLPVGFVRCIQWLVCAVN